MERRRVSIRSLVCAELVLVGWLLGFYGSGTQARVKEKGEERRRPR
jgi:hypothetical protein